MQNNKFFCSRDYFLQSICIILKVCISLSLVISVGFTKKSLEGSKEVDNRLKMSIVGYKEVANPLFV